MIEDDLTVGSITMDDGEYKIMTNNGLATIGAVTNTGMVTSATIASGYSGTTASTITIGSHFDVDEFLDEHIMNRIAIDHKVQEQELMKLKEVAPDYAAEIKENLSKNAARDIIKKMTFTKKHDKDADVHHFIGRVWVFTEDEIRNLIEEARNVS
jgi:hypothetical protein